MKNLLLPIFFVLAVSGHAQKIILRSVTQVDINTIPYPNSLGSTTSSQPQKGTVKLTNGSEVKGKITFFKKKEVFNRVKVNTGEEKMEIPADQIASIVYEKEYPNNFKNPEKNFQPGYIVLPNGMKMTGRVAQLRDFSDYDFFVYNVAFLPEGTTVASTFKGGRLVEFGQEINGVVNHWDGYADGYLLRLTDGRFRLSRNPYSKTKNEFFTSVKNQAADELSKEVAGQALANNFGNGQNVNESLENAANAGQVVQEVLGGIEINKKEYLIFDSVNKSVETVNKSNLKEVLQKISRGCADAGEPIWDKIVEFINQLNSSCK
jgi:sRNA-binding regulator protein Hfq